MDSFYTDIYFGAMGNHNCRVTYSRLDHAAIDIHSVYMSDDRDQCDILRFIRPDYIDQIKQTAYRLSEH